MMSPVLHAGLWMMGALASFTTMAICGRELSADLSTSQIMFWRSVVGFLLILVLLQISGWGQLKTGIFRTHAFRAVAHFGAQFCWFYAIPLIALAELFAIEFTMPIWTAILAALFLGERLTPARICAITLGFAGAMVIIRPGVAEVGIGAMSALLAAMGFAVATITVRMLAQQDSPLCILFYMTLVQLPIGFGLALESWAWPDSQTDGPWIVLVGFTGCSAHYCMANAMRLAEATVVVTMDFMRLPLIALVGYFVYNENLETSVAVGAMLVCAGIYLIVRDADRREGDV